MGRSMHCTDCGQTTNHTWVDQFGPDDHPHIYQCHSCNRYRTADETDNPWLQLLSRFQASGVKAGKRTAVKELGFDITDPEYWEVTEGLDPEEAEQRAKDKARLPGPP